MHCFIFFFFFINLIYVEYKLIGLKGSGTFSEVYTSQSIKTNK